MAMATMVHVDQWSNTRAQLTDAEKASVNMLSDWLASSSSSTTLDEPQRIGGAKVLSRPTSASSDRATGPSLPSAPLVDAPSFLSWYTKQQSFVTPSRQPVNSRALKQLSQAADEADVLLDHLEAARVHISELRAGAQFVEEGNEGLREEAETMVDRMDHLAELSRSLSLRLSYFSILPASTSFLSSPSLNLVTSSEFLLTMDRLDVALAFIDAHPHYRDSPLYKMRFEHCVLRAGTLIRMYSLSRWKELVQEASFKLRTWEKERSSSGKEKAKEPETGVEGLMYLGETSVSAVLWDRFSDEVSMMRPLIVELEKRASSLAAPASTDIKAPGTDAEEPSDEKAMLADYYQEGERGAKPKQEDVGMPIFRSPEFVNLLNECRQAYFEARKSILSSMIANCLAQVEVATMQQTSDPSQASQSTKDHSSSSIVAFITRSLSFLVAVCEKEVALCQQFFDISTEADSESYKDLTQYILTLCLPLDEKIRARVSREASMSMLSSICLALVGGEELERDSSPLIYSILATSTLRYAQDRLLSRAKALIAGPTMMQFTPQDDDVDFPAKIRKNRNHRRAQSSIGGAGLLEAAAAAESSQSGFKQMDESDPASSIRLFASPAAAIVSSWYPPLATTLSLLSAANDALPTVAFVELAYSAVDVCRASILRAGEYMSSQGGLGAGRIGLSGRMDVPLFLLRHLYLLREILASIELRKTSRGTSQVDRRAAGSASAVQAGNATIIDLAKLVDTINALWAGLRGYSGNAKDANSVGEKAEVDTSSAQHSALEAGISTASSSFVEVVYHGVVLPLRVFMDQRSRPARNRKSISETTVTSPPVLSPTQELKSPPLSSIASPTPLNKVRSAVKAFETCAQTNLREANEAMRLYLEDHRAIEVLAESIADRIIETYTSFTQSLETSGVAVSEIDELREISIERGRLLRLLTA